MTPPGSGAVSNTFDANDNQTARGSDSFTWNIENRITSMTVAGTTTTATYNGDGMREARTSGGTTTSYVWDAVSGTVLDDGTQYIYGVGLVSRVVGAGTLYYLTDGLGSTMAIVDATGTVGASYTYDAFGSTKTSAGTQGSEYQFASQDTDPSGLQYLRARYYDPSTGRFLSRDPSRGCIYGPATHHPFTYADNNPARLIDATGLAPSDWAVGAPGVGTNAPSPDTNPILQMFLFLARRDSTGTEALAYALSVGFKVTYGTSPTKKSTAPSGASAPPNPLHVQAEDVNCSFGQAGYAMFWVRPGAGSGLETGIYKAEDGRYVATSTGHTTLPCVDSTGCFVLGTGNTDHDPTYAVTELALEWSGNITASVSWCE